MKKKKEHHTHHHWEGIDKAVKTFFIWILLFLTVLNFINIIEQKSSSLETVYEDCTNSCRQKHFEGLQIGTDRISGDADRIYVNEFDRTNCIKSCNQMYIQLKK